MEVTVLHLCPILLVRSKSQASSTLKEKELYKSRELYTGISTRIQALWGVALESVYHMVKIKAIQKYIT